MRPVTTRTAVDEQGMAAAIAAAKVALETGQSPFGAAVFFDGQQIACAGNTVWRDNDPTAHAEVNAIRIACQKLGTISLSGCTLYSTCEPCPMCFAAAHWAQIPRIVFGATINDAADAGFRELRISNLQLRQLAQLKVEIVSGVSGDECRELFRRWRQRADARAY